MYLEPSGKSPIKGYTNTQIVQRAIMAHPVEPLEMFAAARVGLSVSNDIYVYGADVCLSDKHIHGEYTIEDISRLFMTGSTKLRQLFHNFRLNFDTFINIYYGADEFGGTYLISVMRSSLSTSVTYVSTNNQNLEKMTAAIKELMLKEIVPEEAIKA